ncbi:hypothetical protein HK101_009796 [Irineochytrium annulatum]|nr:hypothetical protein HK101_009796 [Irineochytrium annulatum]
MKTTFLLAALSTVTVASAASNNIPDMEITDKVKAAVVDDFLALQQSDFFVPIAASAPARRGLAKRGGGGGGGGGPPASCPKPCINGNECRVGCKTAIFTPTTFLGSNDTARVHEYRPQNVVFVSNGMPCARPDGCNIQISDSQSATVSWSLSVTVSATFDGFGTSITAEYGESRTTTHAQTNQIGEYGFLKAVISCLKSPIQI